MRFASSKTLWLLVSAGAVAALAWSAQQQHAPRAVRAPAPPIRARDELPPSRLRTQLDFELGLSDRLGTSTADYACVPGPCTPADLQRLRAQIAERRNNVRPAPGTEPRVVAELRGTALLLAWRNGANRLCLDAPRLPSGSGSVFGPCSPGEPCNSICLHSQGEGATLASLAYLLAGTVDSGATGLRITRAAGPPEIYPLRGPVIPGTRSRVFMLELGRRDWRILELLRGDRVTAVRKTPPYLAALEDCQERYRTAAALQRCVKHVVPFP